MKNKKFLPLEHMADIKYALFGKSLNEIFENAVLAFSSYISSSCGIKPKIKKYIELESDNSESLLYKFLDELIYLLDAEDFAVAKSKVKIENSKLRATLYGESTKKLHLNHVKAATYAEMYVKKSRGSWKAQIVLDV